MMMFRYLTSFSLRSHRFSSASLALYPFISNTVYSSGSLNVQLFYYFISNIQRFTLSFLSFRMIICFRLLQCIIMTKFSLSLSIYRLMAGCVIIIIVKWSLFVFHLDFDCYLSVNCNQRARTVTKNLMPNILFSGFLVSNGPSHFHAKNILYFIAVHKINKIG